MMALPIPSGCDTCQCTGQSSTSSTGGTVLRQYYQGHGEPNDTSFLPEDQTLEALYTDLDTGVLYAWVPGSLSWV